MTSARGLALALVILAGGACSPVAPVPPPTATLPRVSPAPASVGHNPDDEYSMAVAALHKVASFTALLNAGSYDRIWADTDDLLRRETTKEKFLASLEEIHRTFGVPTHTTLIAFQFEDRDGATFLYLLYDLDFPAGPAQEQFTWRVTSSNLVTLVAYHIERVTPTPTPTLRG